MNMMVPPVSPLSAYRTPPSSSASFSQPSSSNLLGGGFPLIQHLQHQEQANSQAIAHLAARVSALEQQAAQQQSPWPAVQNRPPFETPAVFSPMDWRLGPYPSTPL